VDDLTHRSLSKPCQTNPAAGVQIDNAQMF